VSTFVTECPYCGTRLQKRAPRLDRKDGDLEALLRLPTLEPDRTLREREPDDDVVVPLKRKRRSIAPKVPRSSTGKPRKVPGRAKTKKKKASTSYATEGKAYATFAIVLVSLIGLPVQQLLSANDLLLLDGSAAWRAVTASLLFTNTWSALAVLTTFGVFGWLWERRAGLTGTAVVVVAFLVAGVGGLLLDRELASGGLLVLYGSAGAAIALATAWLVAELRSIRAGEALDGDVAGATTLLAVPIATTALTADTIPYSIVLGLVLGAALGLALSLARR
jgi:hypothetical protein